MSSKTVFLEKGGEMGSLTRAFDWASTSIGDPDQWSPPHLSSVNMMLTSRFPMLVFWGADLITFYNDAFRPSLGNDGKHPGSLGQPGHISWAESWPVIGPMIHDIMNGGDAVFFEDQKLPLYRDGKMGYAYWTYSFSPLINDNGNVGGVLVTCNETTKAVEATLKLAEGEERFRNMAESTDVLIAVSDDSANAIYFNKAWAKLTGRTQAELINFGWADLVHPDDKVHALNNYLSAYAKQESFTSEFRIQNYSVAYNWLRVQGTPRFRPDGSFAGYVSSCFDITEQKEDDLRKNDLIAMVSHELKTPLTTMSAFLQLLQRNQEISNNHSVASMVSKAVNQTGKMTKMINGFLNVSRLEAGKLTINKARFDMADLVSSIKTDIATLYPARNIIFHPIESALVNADWDKIENVISNFINNAVKYSADGKIDVACVSNDGVVEVSVQDEGIGIRQENIERLFDRFYRIDDVSSITSTSGFGIGLYLCAEIVKRHNGKIRVQSEPDKGSTFCFTLPLADQNSY